MRPAHFLKGLKSSETPSWFVFVDTETKPKRIAPKKIKTVLRFGYACFVRRTKQRGLTYETEEWLRFEKSKELFNWMIAKLRRKTKLYVFMHNAQFDFQVLELWSHLKGAGFKTLKMVIESPPFFLQFRKEDMTIVFVDSLNYFRMSLEMLGEGIGMPKLKMPDRNASQEEWDTYAKNDVMVLKKAILGFIDFVRDNDLGPFQLTLASQAFAAYRHRFMTKPIYIHDFANVCENEREAYYGGRVECFRIGRLKEKMYLLDVNSMYPAVMIKEVFPTQYLGSARNIKQERIAELLEKFCVIAKVKLHAKIPAYPMRRDGKLIFPIGTFETWLTTPEIKFAYEQGHLLEIQDCHIYKKHKIFANAMKELYALRLQYKKKKNEAYSFMVKIMMNSLYGKFGQRGRRWENVIATDDEELDDWVEMNVETGEVMRFRKALGLVQVLENEPEAYNSFPAIAAHITAYSRMVLLTYILKAGWANVYYCDTDSLVVNARGYDKLKEDINSDELGKLKLEKEFDTAQIYGPKDYVFGDRVKIKGIRKNAKRIRKNVYEQDMFWGMKRALKNKLYDTQIIERIVKHLRREYNKGTVRDDGTVIPFLLE